MPKMNIKVRNAFDKLKDKCFIPLESEEIIKKFLQEIYDLGHSDGYAEAWSESNRFQEECGNL